MNFHWRRIRSVTGITFNFVFLSLNLQCASPPPSVEVSLPRTRVEKLEVANGFSYQLQIGLPRGYESGKIFPTVFLLDPEYSFGIVRNIVEHLSDRGDLPDLVVVGIGYPGGIEGEGWLKRYRVQRTRDYTPTYSAKGYPDGVQDVSGGGKQFLDVFEKQIIPFVDARYHTDPSQRIIVGHSYGGLWAGYATMSKPRVFSGAILISPSLWYGDHFLFGYEKSRRELLKDLPLHLFLAAGSREGGPSAGEIASDVQKFARTFEASGYKAADVHAVVLAGETHNSVFPAAISRGLLALLGKHRMRDPKSPSEKP
jgi:uncharacterized protein